MSKGPFGIEEPKLFGFTMTRDGRWLVGHVEDGKWIYLPMLYDSQAQAKEISELLSARDMQRYKTELASVKSMQKD